MPAADLPEELWDNPTAPERARTDWTDVSFAVKAGAGEPVIAIEEYEPGLPVLKAGHAFLVLHFRRGVTPAQARELAAAMNTLLDSLSHTRFVPDRADPTPAVGWQLPLPLRVAVDAAAPARAVVERGA
jgi:hypothetical protein